MNDPLRIGVLGLTHDHVWGNLADLDATPGIEAVAAADPHPELLQRYSESHSGTTYDSYYRLLEAERLDAVWIFGDNAVGVELFEAAAAAGLSAMIEKPLAHTLAGAERMLAAARRHDVRLMVNWPFAWWPALQRALEMAAAGEIGRLWQVKYRAAHEGPENLGCTTYFCDWLFDARRNGAGAFIDYCCYGAALARLLLGVPSRVTGLAQRLQKEHITVDDHGVLTMTYPDAVAIAEGAWLEVGKLSAYTTYIYGNEGTLLAEPRKDGRLLLATRDHPAGRALEIPQPPSHLQTSAAHFAHCLRTGAPFAPLCQARPCRDVQEILSAGLLSAREGREISLPLPLPDVAGPTI